MKNAKEARLYSIYVGMKFRCYNHNASNYKYYGAKGIKICSEWLGVGGFQAFVEWSLNNGYEAHLTIDRIDSEKNYAPCNCRWITKSENSSRICRKRIAIKKRERYVYPAILNYEKGYEIAVTFPDLPGCATSGATEIEAIAAGREALGLHLWGMERDGDLIPVPSSAKDIELDDGEVIAVIDVYMPSIRLAQENKSVNRTVTLPAWLDARAKECGVNFSQLLQDAIKKEISVQNNV